MVTMSAFVDQISDFFVLGLMVLMFDMVKKIKEIRRLCHQNSMKPYPRFVLRVRVNLMQ